MSLVNFISTKTIIIHGHQGGGKTLFASCLSSDFIDRIYGNVGIFKDGKKISIDIKKMSFLNTLSFSKIPGVGIFDEIGLNFNSKEHASKKNKLLLHFFFLVRKFNLSTIFVSQRYMSIPVDIRELADFIFEVSVIPRKGKHPLFRITRQKQNNEGFLEFEQEFIFDLIEYNKIQKITYDTLESSIIEE